MVWACAVQIGLQCGGDFDGFHDGYFGFCPAKSQLYLVVAKLSQEKAANQCIPLLADRQ
jgi:hypothetical protein